MDPSIFKLLEEDEDESMHSGADVDAFQAALNRDIEGSTSLPLVPTNSGDVVSSPFSKELCVKFLDLWSDSGNNHSPNQQFTTWKNGIGDSNMNLQTQHSLESTQMKEQQGSGLENQHQHDLKRASESHLQHKQSQDLHRAGQLWENPSQVPQTNGLQISEKNPTGNEPERPHNQESESQYLKLQKMSSQQARGLEQPVNPMKRNPKQVTFAPLLPILMAQLDKDRALQLRTLYSRLRKNEIPKEGFTRHMKDIVGDQMLRLAVSKLQQVCSATQLAFEAKVKENREKDEKIRALKTRLKKARRYEAKIAEVFSEVNTLRQSLEEEAAFDRQIPKAVKTCDWEMTETRLEGEFEELRGDIGSFERVMSGLDGSLVYSPVSPYRSEGGLGEDEDAGGRAMDTAGTNNDTQGGYVDADSD